jgi:hypothetical protein
MADKSDKVSEFSFTAKPDQLKLLGLYDKDDKLVPTKGNEGILAKMAYVEKKYLSKDGKLDGKDEIELRRLLGTDKDGKVTEKELKAAAEKLTKELNEVPLFKPGNESGFTPVITADQLRGMAAIVGVKIDPGSDTFKFGDKTPSNTPNPPKGPNSPSK